MMKITPYILYRNLPFPIPNKFSICSHCIDNPQQDTNCPQISKFLSENHGQVTRNNKDCCFGFWIPFIATIYNFYNLLLFWFLDSIYCHASKGQLNALIWKTWGKMVYKTNVATTQRKPRLKWHQVLHSSFQSTPPFVSHHRHTHHFCINTLCFDGVAK